MPKDDRAQAKPAVTVTEDRRVDFGSFLRQARERRGVTLPELAVTTKISGRVLEALERNDPSKLPGGIFSRAFVRAYASEVGLDPEAAVASFVSAFPDESGAEDMPSAASAVEAESFEQQRRVLKVAVGVLAAAAVVAVLLFVYYAAFRPGARPAEPAATQSPAAETLSQAPAPAQSRLPEPVPASATVPGEPPADGARDVAEPASGQPEAAPPASVATQAEPAPAAGTPAAAARSQQGSLVVVLRATEACWLSILVDGTRVPSRTLGAGERVEFTVERSITMRAGNAGALEITLNGKPARSLGAAGEPVTRTIPAAAYETFLR
jgi:cytoskeleton protein RodZ